MKLIRETFGTWTWRDDILAFRKAAGCLVQWEEFLILGLELLSCVSPPSLYSLFFSLERFLHTCVFSPRTKSSRWENSHIRWLYPYQFSPIGTTLPHPSTSEMLSSLFSFLNSGLWLSMGSDNWMHYRLHCSHGSINPRIALHGPPKLPRTPQLRFESMVSYGWQ